MSTYQLGFIGTGNMGGALAQAAAKSGAGMLLSNRTADKAVRLAAELGCAAGTNLFGNFLTTQHTGLDLVHLIEPFRRDVFSDIFLKFGIFQIF